MVERISEAVRNTFHRYLWNGLYATAVRRRYEAERRMARRPSRTNRRLNRRLTSRDGSNRGLRSHVESMCRTPRATRTTACRPLVRGGRYRGPPVADVDRDRLEGSEIRQRMIDDESWRDRVPASMWKHRGDPRHRATPARLRQRSLERYAATGESLPEHSTTDD